MTQEWNHSHTTVPVSRRCVLRATGAVLPLVSTGVLSSLAGCTTRATGETSSPTVTSTATPTATEAPISTTERPPSDASAAAILADAPFGPPRDLDLFSSNAYPDASDMEVAGFSPLDPDEIRATLEATLRDRFDHDPAREQRVREAMTLLDDPRLEEIVPDIRLRAAMVNLKGTVGEPAIDAYLAGTYRRVSFGFLPGVGNFARVRTPIDGSPEVHFNTRYRFEDFRLLTLYMAHEALHREGEVNELEEVIADSLDTLVHAEVVLTTPELVSGGTEMSRILNTKLMGRLNSRDESGNMTVRGGKGAVLPGSSLPGIIGFGDMVDHVRGEEEDKTDWITQQSLPGNDTLDAIVSRVVGRDVSGLDFDPATVDLIDEQELLSARDQVRLFELLTLV